MSSFDLRSNRQGRVFRCPENYSKSALVNRMISNFILDHRSSFMQLWKTGVIIVSLWAAYMLRFDFAIPATETRHIGSALVIALMAKMLVFYLLGLDRGLWRFTGATDVPRIFVANILGSTLFTIATAVLVGRNFPRAVYLIDLLLCFLLICGCQLTVRLYHEMRIPGISKSAKGLLIYGAGEAGLNLVREIRSTANLQYRIVGFLDDDGRKQQATLLGVRVLGRGRDAARIVERYRHKSSGVDEIVIALPSASGRTLSEALANCRASGVPCKTIPSSEELLSGKVRASQIREVTVENLLGRAPVSLELENIRESASGRCVMVTGAGGSIGSELCRQLIQFRPKCLIALDQAESDLFKIDLELRQRSHGEKV